MNRSNCTNLKQFEGGRVVKQGDSASLFGFALILRGRKLQSTLPAKRAKRHFRRQSKAQKYRLRFPKSYRSRAILSRWWLVGTSSRVTRVSGSTWSSQRTSTQASKSLRLSKTTSRKRSGSLSKRTKRAESWKNFQI